MLTADSFQSQDEKKNGGLAYQQQQMAKEIPFIPSSLPAMLKREAWKIGPAEIPLIKNEKLSLKSQPQKAWVGGWVGGFFIFSSSTHTTHLRMEPGVLDCMAA